MKHLLRRLPFFETETFADAPTGRAAVRPFQIVAWVSLGLDESLGSDAPRFPCILDTGNNHNFAIQEDHLEQWAGLSLRDSQRLGTVLLGEEELPLPLVRAAAWLHSNKPGQRDAHVSRTPFRIEMPQGIIVYPRGVPTSARLPILGMRAIVRNNLRLTIDGSQRLVSLRTS